MGNRWNHWGMASSPAGGSSNSAKGGWKVTFDQPITVWTPHQVKALVNSKGTEWLSPRRLSQVQVMLLDKPVAMWKLILARTPHSLGARVQSLVREHHGARSHMMQIKTKDPKHCIETADTIYFSCLRLVIEPLSNAEEEWFTDGSSFLTGKRLMGYPVTFQTKILEATSLPPGTSAQNAKLITFTRALEIGQRSS